ncbi:MAG: SGNH/GDSL hydrolase family protein [Chloroflexota bacterium]|nr:SGNH/GDSL hydrolase family protein [Chloroflexota bacterium]
MGHVVLLGDSIFDNAAYVAGGPPVITQLRARLPEGWQATLCAIDGSVTGDVHRQLLRLPPDATHLVVSVGGNDALGQSGILSERARSVAEVLERLAALGAHFERDYRRMVHAVRTRALPTALCTIYYPSYPDALIQRLTVAGLTIFNDCIIRAAIGAGLPLIDLRLICNTPADYANPIEPSVLGGAKIASVITSLVTGHDFSQSRTVVFA